MPLHVLRNCSVLSDSGLMGPAAQARVCVHISHIHSTYTVAACGCARTILYRPVYAHPGGPGLHTARRLKSASTDRARAASGPGGPSEIFSQLRPRRRLARTPAGEGVLQRPIRRGGRQRRVGVGLAVLGAFTPPFIRCDGHAAQVRSKASLPSPRNPTRLDEGSRQLQERRRIGRGGASRDGDGTLQRHGHVIVEEPARESTCMQ